MLLLLLACRTPPPTNIIWILTDDQRADTLWAMPNVQEHLVAEGVLFNDSNVSTPLCCPSRGSMFSGGFLPQEVGVLSNEPPNGSVSRFTGGPSLAERIHNNGYRTGYFGKYLNGSDTQDSFVVPEGWDHFYLLRSPFDYRAPAFFEGAAGEYARAVEPGKYLTDAITDGAIDFVRSSVDPYFLVVAHYAPHTPLEVPPGDDTLFADYTWRPESMDEDLSDKPAWVTEEQIEPGSRDESIRDQLQALQSLDRGVGRLIDALEETDQLDHTVIIFFSDNGLSWVEHGVWGKGMPYAESLRVPLVIRAPGVEPGERGALVVANLDVPATTQALAGLPVFSQGQSLLPLLAGLPGGHEIVPIGYYTPDRPLWSGILTPDWKYIRNTLGDEELYDRAADPFELDGALDPGGPVEALRAEDEARRGLIITETMFEVPLEAAFELTIPTWGGVAPLSFSATNLPAGLTLDGDRLYGLLRGSEVRDLTVTVIDSGRTLYTGEPHQFVQRIELYPTAAAGPARPRRSSDLLGPPRRDGEAVVLRRGHVARTWIQVSPDPDFDRDVWTSEEKTGAELRFEEVPPGWLRVVGQPGRWER